MSRPHPLRPRTVGLLAVGVLVVVLLAVAIRSVRMAAPEVTLPPVGDAAPDVDAPELVTCERTLPEAPDTEELGADVSPVGLVNSTEVIECPDAFDGHVVVYRGEVVGDVLQRDGGGWLLVNDDDYALEAGPLRGHGQYAGTNSGLSVWLPAPLPELVPGGADRRGTIIQVRGVVRRADPADGGGLTLRAVDPESTTIVAGSQPLDQPVNRAQAIVAGAFALVAAILYVMERRSVGQR